MSLHEIKKLRNELKKYVLFVVLPILMGSVLFTGVHLTTGNLMEKYGSVSVQDFQSAVRSYLSEIELTAKTLLHNSAFTDYVSAPDTSEFSKLTPCEIIRLYKQECDYIGNVYVLNEQQNVIYTESGYFSYACLPEMLKKMGVSVSTNTSFHDLPIQEGWNCNNNGVFSPFYSIRIHAEENKRSDYMVLITMDRRYLFQLMNSMEVALCCIYNENCSIYSLISIPHAVDWSDPADVSLLLEKPVKCFYSSDSEFTYLVAISSQQYNTPQIIVLFLFILYFGVLTVSFAIQILKLSRNRSNMVSSLLGILSNRTDLSYTEETAYETISQALQNYQQETYNKLSVQKANNLRLILFDMIGTNVSDSQYRSAGIDPEAHAFFAITFFVEDYSTLDTILPSSEMSERDNLIQTVLQTSLMNLAGEHMSVAFTNKLHDFSAVVSILDVQTTSKDITVCVSEVLHTVEVTYGMRIIACISGMVTSPGELSAAFQQTYTLYHFSKIIGSNACIISQDDVSANMDVLLHDNFLQQITMLSNALVSEKFDLIPQAIHAILSEHITNETTDCSMAISRLNCVASLLLEAVIHSSIPSSDISYFKQELQHSPSADDLYQLALEFSQIAQSCASSDSNTSIQDACRFMEENYANVNLSVPDVCESVNLSVQHLSRLFRQQLDITITEYLNNCRIDHAKRLLKNTNLSVKVISDHVGYNTPITFTRNFKKLTGMTPQTYRAISANRE